MSEQGFPDPRDAAIKRLRARRAFFQHLVLYLAINALLVFIWASSGGGYFWPAWAIAGWGVAVILNAWDVYSPPVTEADIQNEINRYTHQ